MCASTMFPQAIPLNKFTEKDNVNNVNKVQDLRSIRCNFRHVIFLGSKAQSFRNHAEVDCKHSYSHWTWYHCHKVYVHPSLWLLLSQQSVQIVEERLNHANIGIQIALQYPRQKLQCVCANTYIYSLPWRHFSLNAFLLFYAGMEPPFLLHSNW